MIIMPHHTRGVNQMMAASAANAVILDHTSSDKYTVIESDGNSLENLISLVLK